jgi:hypothetical protein
VCKRCGHVHASQCTGSIWAIVVQLAKRPAADIAAALTWQKSDLEGEGQFTLIRFWTTGVACTVTAITWYCYVLKLSLLSDTIMQTDGLSAMPHNNANMLVATSLVTLAAVQHYYVRDYVHVERRFLELQVVTVNCGKPSGIMENYWLQLTVVCFVFEWK